MQTKQTSGKQIAAIVLLAVGLIAGVLGVLGMMGGGRIDPYDARNGVVFIYFTIRDDEGNTQSGWGTGWAIGKPGKPVQYIVTNGHVVEYPYAYPKQYSNISGSLDVYFSVAENDFVAGQVVYYSAPSEKDLAIIKLPSPTDKREALKIRSSADVAVGETVFALGYPGTATIGQDFQAFDQNDITLTQGVISKRLVPSGHTYSGFQMDTYISGGNSGGPLVDKNGHVVGIHQGGIVNNATGIDLGLNYAIESDELLKILNSEGIDYTLAGGGLSWVQSWFAYVFLPIAVLALAGGVVLLTTSQKTQSVPVASGAAVQAGGPVRGGQKRAVLRGVTGKYAGQSFDLLKGKVIIGRDPALCNIVYDKNTPGISGRHCQVAYDATSDCFIITDLGSSYGTFLGNGKKLAANVAERMSAGDTFYLCDNANRFVVSKD